MEHLKMIAKVTVGCIIALLLIDTIKSFMRKKTITTDK